MLLYGSETWVLTPKLKRLLNSFCSICLRIILGIKQEQHLPNEDVYSQAKMRVLTSTVKERQLRFLGHSLRRPIGDIIPQLALYHPAHGKRNRGCPQTMYPSYVADLLSNTINILPLEKEINIIAQHQKEWKRHVKVACYFDPP